MSVESVFYPGAISDQTAASFMKSPLWSMALGTHNNLEGKLFVVQIGPSEDVCVMCDVHGFPILRIKLQSNKFKFILNSNPRSSGFFGDHTVLADSPNRRYLLSRLGDTTKGKRKLTMREAIMNMVRLMNDVGYRIIIKEMLSAFTSKLHPALANSAYEINLEAQEWALLVAYGRKQLVEVPSSIKSMLDKAHAMHAEKHTRLDTFLATANDFLDREKWIATHVPSYGYLCAKIHGKELVSFCKAQTKYMFGNNFHDKYMNFVEQPRYYRDASCMPELTRRELMAALAMAKANRPEGVVRSYLDPDKLIPDIGQETFLLQERVGALASKEGHLTWVMVDA